jgi:hypothetical protein
MRTRVGPLDEWLVRMTSKRARMAFTSGGLEPVLDNGGGNHSVFAKALLETLEKNDKPQDMSSLAKEIQRIVVKTAIQTPLYNDIHDVGGGDGDFVFIPK